MRLLPKRDTQPVVKTVLVTGTHYENGEIFDIDGELDYVSGTTSRMKIGTILDVDYVYNTRRGQTVLRIYQNRNTAMKLRAVRGVFAEGDSLRVVEIIYKDA